VACADLQAEAVEETARRLRERGATALARACDVSDPESCRAAVRAAVERFGGLHVLCNIAGILRFAHSHEVALAEWNQVLAVNLTGTFLMCQAALPALLESRGAIVNVSSTAALRGHAWTAAYSASKGGVLALTYELAIEYGQQGLRVNAVCPGGINTPIQSAFQVPAGANPKLVRRIMPFDGFGEAADAASAIAFLASDDVRYVNGTMLRVDGAMCT